MSQTSRSRSARLDGWNSPGWSGVFQSAAAGAPHTAALRQRRNPGSHAIRPHFGISYGSLLNYRLVIRRGAARLFLVIENL